MSRGLYALPEYQGGEHAALATVTKRAPNVVFCLLTAYMLLAGKREPKVDVG